MKKAVIYARFSSHKQQETSIEGQIKVCEDYARREGIEIIDTYIDRAISLTISLFISWIDLPETGLIAPYISKCSVRMA